tara:strand:+ start:390 stop:575 length:186 start_codon:yes stop_codon:yes gene_type:complete
VNRPLATKIVRFRARDKETKPNNKEYPLASTEDKICKRKKYRFVFIYIYIYRERERERERR